MLGAIDAAPKPRKPAARRVQKKKVGALERPVELVNTEDQEKQETDRNMEEMWKVGTPAACLMDLVGFCVSTNVTSECGLRLTWGGACSG